jgi:2-dehydro-3-deoxygalactonokinase
MNISAAAPTALIGLDWGTSSLRAFRYDALGQVVERRHSDHGITRLPAAGDEGFAQALALVAGDWLLAHPTVPVVASGMVGSAQGWREAAYVALPAAASQLGQGGSKVTLDGVATHVPGADAQAWAQRTMTILPGLIERGPAPVLPNVMRGEETQIFGALLQADAPDDLVVVLPGTHSKWVRVQRGVVTHFDSFMTGEVFAALKAHTILGRTMAPNEGFAADAFARGLQVAASAQGANGALSTIFSTRTLGLEGQLPGDQQADYLSGLLIGHEVHAMALQLAQRQPLAQCPVWLIGSDALCARYVTALQAAGLTQLRTMPQATEAGLWSMATASGLVAA